MRGLLGFRASSVRFGRLSSTSRAKQIAVLPLKSLQPVNALTGVLTAVTLAMSFTSTALAAAGAAQSSAPIQDFIKEVYSLRRGNIEVRAAVWQIPHDQKRDKGGEDTYLLTPDVRALGVFDGVGGWADSGVDPRHYSYGLATACARTANEQPESDREKEVALDPVKLLNTGYELARSSKIIGSTTATIGTLSAQGVLRVAHLGDSGVMVIREGKFALRSIEQQHEFNMPYQLGSQSSDRPNDARRYEIQLVLGDIVLFGTDGLLDNLDDSAILDEFQKHSKSLPQEQARAVATAAYAVSKDRSAITPFTRHAREILGAEWRGGKEDDITVLVVQYGAKLKASL